MTSPGLMQCVWLRVEQSGGLACKAGLGVDGLDWGLWRYAVCVALQDALDGAVSRAVMRQGALAGVFQARRAIGLGQADDALSCAQALQDVIWSPKNGHHKVYYFLTLWRSYEEVNTGSAVHG